MAPDLRSAHRDLRCAVALWVLMIGSLFGAVVLGPGPELSRFAIGAALVIGSALLAGALAFAGEGLLAGVLGGLVSGALTLGLLALCFRAFGPFPPGMGPLFAFFPGPMVGWRLARLTGRAAERPSGPRPTVF
ncbi:MAG: hypothetical protein AAGH15_17090 [Myxococcota bacterium]